MASIIKEFRAARVSRFASVFFLAGVIFGANKLAPELERADGNAVKRVIVQFDTTGVEPHQRILGRHGIRLRNHLPLVNGSVVEASGRQLRELADDPNVESIVPDRQVNATDFSGTTDFGWMTVLDVANSSTPLPYDGDNIGVAVIDSGVDTVDDLKDPSGHSRIVYNESFVPKDNGTADDYGHGTHIAGIIAGNGKHSTGGKYTYTIRGIAPGVNIVNLRVLDDHGSGTDSAVIAAIQRAIQLKSMYNIRIINLSLGRGIPSSYTTDPLCQAVQQAWAAGIVVVVAAGNGGRDDSHHTSGYGTITAPGNSPAVITVGAMNTVGSLGRADDKITSYSSKGPTQIDHIVKPDIVAPGNKIFSLRDNGSFLDKAHPENRVPVYVYSSDNNKSTPDYYELSGTSMAAPMVSGAAALLLQQEPKLTPDQIKAKLMRTASKSFPASSVATDPETNQQYVSEYDIFTIGAGYLDIGAAVNYSGDPPAGLSAASPQAVYNSANKTVSIVNGKSIIWGDSIIWGTSIVWGTNVFLNGTSIIWGTGVVWGANSTQGFSIIWGTTAIGGDSKTTPDGSSSVEVAILGDK